MGLELFNKEKSMPKKNIFHIPVLLNEVIEVFDPKPGQNYIDCTMGFGGHSEELLKMTSPSGKLMGIDLDPKAIMESKKRLSEFKSRCVFVNDNFINLKKIASANNFDSIDGILFDLGMSSYQLQDTYRGFSYKDDGAIDMRFGVEDVEISAKEIINQSSEAELINILKKYGEFKYHEASQIVKLILKERKTKEIEKTTILVAIVESAFPDRYNKAPILSRAFQAFRIATNRELFNLKKSLSDAVGVVKRGGKIACISYHSLEDRIVKNYFKLESRDCICPDELPVCKCGHKAKLKVITKKPINPENKEIKINPRSRSAKLRVAQKI